MGRWVVVCWIVVGALFAGACGNKEERAEQVRQGSCKLGIEAVQLLTERLPVSDVIGAVDTPLQSICENVLEALYNGESVTLEFALTGQRPIEELVHLSDFTAAPTPGAGPAACYDSYANIPMFLTWCYEGKISPL
jgi:hypothetical protein